MERDAYALLIHVFSTVCCSTKTWHFLCIFLVKSIIVSATTQVQALIVNIWKKICINIYPEPSYLVPGRKMESYISVKSLSLKVKVRNLEPELGPSILDGLLTQSYKGHTKGKKIGSTHVSSSPAAMSLRAMSTMRLSPSPFSL